MTFYPNKSYAVWLLMACSIFVAIGIWMGRSEGLLGYICAAFFALGIPVFIIQLLPGSTYLHIDSNGFTVCNLFRKSFVPWSVVDVFFVVTLKQTGVKIHEMVGFNFVPSYERAQIGRNISKAIGNCEGALPDTYGKKAEDLAEIMNSYLLKFKTSEGEPENRPDR